MTTRAAKRERQQRLADFPELGEGPVGEDRGVWIESMIQVVDPDRRVPVPMIPNAMQRDILASLERYEITVKARRMGLTSIYCADAWLDICFIPGTKVELFAHDWDTAEAIFEQVIIPQYKSLPDWVRPITTSQNTREIVFEDIGSHFKVGTAGQSDAVAKKQGQARTINHLILTEFAFYAYAEDFFDKIKNCVPVATGKIRIDSTPDGQNSFYRRFKRARAGQTQYIGRFYPWWWSEQCQIPLDDGEEIEPTKEELTLGEDNPFSDERNGPDKLTPEQIKFRRFKMNDLEPRGALTARDVFMVEYPEDEDTCFLHSGRPCFLASYLRKSPCWFCSDEPEVETADCPHCKGSGLTEERDAIEGHDYSLGHDASTGDASGHPAGCTVVDIDTGEQVYEWRGWEPVEGQAQRLIEIAQIYNSARIVVERNYPGEAVIALLKEYGVRNLYRHKDRTMKEHVNVKPWRLKPGFPMNDGTKKRLFADLEVSLSKGLLRLSGRKTISELKGFQYDEEDRVQFDGSADFAADAGETSHGELGIALGLAWWGRKSGSVGAA